MLSKRIAFVTPDLRSGGSERSASELTIALSSRFEKMYYMVFNSEEISYKIDAELIDINAPASANIVKKVFNTFKRARGIRKAVKKNNIDTVMSFTPIANRALRYSRAKCRKIAACRGFDDLMRHPGEYHECIKKGCSILFNSLEAMNYYFALYPNDRNKCVTIENLIDCARIREMAEEPLEQELEDFYRTHKVITTVASFSKYKGHWELLKSFAVLKKTVPDAGLVLVGHMGELEDKLRKAVLESEYSEDIIFVGYSSNPFKYVSKSMVYALPSISEGFPNALVEAMCCGTPCVSVVCRTGPRELLFDSDFDRTVKGYVIADNGIAVSEFEGTIDFNLANISESHVIFASALERVLKDENLRSVISKKGLNRAEKNDKSKIEEQYLRFLER